MYCTQCGFKLEDDMTMCPVCGHLVEKDEQSPEAVAEKMKSDASNTSFEQEQPWQSYGANDANEGQAAGNYQAPTNNTQQYSGYSQYNGNYGGYNAGANQQPNGQYYGSSYYNQMMQNQPGQPKKKSGGKITAIVIICVLVVVAFVVGLFVVLGSSSKTSVDDDFEPYTNSNKDGVDDDIYQDYGDSPFYDNPFTEDGEQTSGEDVSLYKGTISDDVYTNEFFGVSYSIPSTYYYLTEDEIVSYYGDDNNDMSIGVVGLDVVGDNYSEMVIYSQEIGNFSAEFYLRTFINNTVSGIEDSDYSISDAENVQIGGVDFVKSDVEFLNYDPDTQYNHNTYYVCEKDGVFLVISVFYDNVQDHDNLMENFI